MRKLLWKYTSLLFLKALLADPLKSLSVLDDADGE